MKVFLVSILVCFAGRANATLCDFDTRDRKSDAYLKDVYKESPLIGVYEVVSISSPQEGFSGWYDFNIELKPVKITKGNYKRNHVFVFSTPQGSQAAFEVSKRYLFTLRRDAAKSYSSCGNPLEVPEKDAEFYLKKFEKFRKGDS
jgi:hypothetical protein